MKGRFPANLLVSDDVLNDGIIHKSGTIEPHHKFKNERITYGKYNKPRADGPIATYGDSGSYSRFFSLDAWYDEMFGTD